MPSTLHALPIALRAQNARLNARLALWIATSAPTTTRIQAVGGTLAAVRLGTPRPYDGGNAQSNLPDAELSAWAGTHGAYRTQVNG